MNIDQFYNLGNLKTLTEIKVIIVINVLESYDAALEKLKLAQDISDIDAVTEEQYKKSRHYRAKVKKVTDSESSDDSANKKEQT